MTWLTLFVGQDLYNSGKALADLSGLYQLVKSICKEREKHIGDKKVEKVCLGYSQIEFPKER